MNVNEKLIDEMMESGKIQVAESIIHSFKNDDINAIVVFLSDYLKKFG